jgi:hypothetical protein
MLSHQPWMFRDLFRFRGPTPERGLHAWKWGRLVSIWPSRLGRTCQLDRKQMDQIFVGRAMPLSRHHVVQALFGVNLRIGILYALELWSQPAQFRRRNPDNRQNILLISLFRSESGVASREDCPLLSAIFAPKIAGRTKWHQNSA